MLQRIFVAFLGLTCLSLSAASISGVTVLSGTGPVPQYSKYEIGVALTTSAATTKYFEARPASGGIDLSATFTNGSTNIKAFGFWDGSAWKIRFAPTLPGTWTYKVTAIDSTTLTYPASGSLSLDCVASTDPGFARINGQYLKFSNGQAKFVAGVNNGWQYDVEQPSLSTMKSRGLNVLSFWMNSPWITSTDPDPVKRRRVPIENVTQGAGNYNQEACAYLDGVVDRADAAGVYLLPSIWSHGNLRDTQPSGWGTAWWTNNAYKNVCSVSAFFQTTNTNGTETAQWGYQKNHFRYILARWGYSRSIIGFVSVVELDGTQAYVSGSTTKGQAESWTLKVRDYFIANDPYRASGGKYPICATKTDWDGTSTTWNGGDLFGIDSYRQQTNNTEIAQAIGGETVTMRSSGRPVFDAEFGGQVGAGATEPTHLHNGIWAGAASGACMSPLKWCDGGSWPMLTDSTVGEPLIAELQKLSSFMDGLGYVGGAGYGTVTVTPTVSGACRGWGMGVSGKGFAWIQNPSGSIAGKSFTLSSASIGAGTYNICWFDPWLSTSSPLVTQVITITGSSLTLTPPAGASRADVVCQYYINSAPTVAGTGATPNPVTGTTTTLSTSGTDDAGESGLVYTWSVAGTPAPALADNGANSARSTVATFTKAGVYDFSVAATDRAGISSNVGTVSVTVQQTATSASIVPASLTLPQGSAAQFTAQTFDQFGDAIAGGSVSWSATGGTVTADGLYTAGSEAGTYGVDVSISGLQAHATVTIVVNPAPTIVTAAAANPAAVTGTSAAVSVVADDDGGEGALTYTWSCPGVSFSPNGTNAAKNSAATFSSAGNYTLAVTVVDALGSSITSSVDVTVESALTGPIAVTPANQAFALYSQTQYTAMAVDQFGHALSGFAWSCSAGSITSDGVYSATVPGDVTLTASLGTDSGSTTATVNGPPTVAASAENPTVTGATAVLSATGDDDGGEAALAYTWTFSTTSGGNALFGTNGINAAKITTVTFTRAGQYHFTVTATDAVGLTASSSVDVNVVSTLTGSISVSPAGLVLPVNAQQQFSASAFDQFNQPMNGFTWFCSAGTITSGGLFTAPGASNPAVTITAAVNGVSGTSIVRVNAPPTVRTAAAATPASIKKGGTSTLSVLGADDQGEANLTYTWAASPSTGVTISPNGTNAAKSAKATFASQGNYTLTVTIRDADGASKTSSVKVTVSNK